MNNEVIRLITGAKVRCFSYECNKIGAISCETTPYFDVSQKSIKALDQPLREPYQPRWWCTCRSS